MFVRIVFINLKIQNSKKPCFSGNLKYLEGVHRKANKLIRGMEQLSHEERQRIGIIQPEQRSL